MGNGITYYNDDQIQDLYEYINLQYEDDNDLAHVKGVNDEWLKKGEGKHSLVSKLHIIKLYNNFPASESEIPKHRHFFQAKSVADLCKMSDRGAMSYEIEDFLYCKHLGVPINRLITLRRFHRPCIDNIMDKRGGFAPDMCRLVGYSTSEVNKLDDLLQMSYNLRWKQLQSEMSQNQMFGDQSGVSGMIKAFVTPFDSVLSGNALSGATGGGPMSSYDPTHDQNRVYGPVNSIAETHIQDVGLEFSKEIELTFDYELRSINGRTAEFAFKDLLANILAVTYNDATQFWGGARYWVGEQPTPLMNKLQWMNSRDLDTVLAGAARTAKALLDGLINFYNSSKESKIETLKKVMRGAFAVALGKILDNVGRPGIWAGSSLLSGAPVGFWHLTVGNPYNPILTMGNLILTGTDLKFPTDALSYGDFPTKMQVVCKLKPGKPIDRAGIEMAFNGGQKRLYWAPKSVKRSKHKNKTSRKYRTFDGYTAVETGFMLQEAYTFIGTGEWTKKDVKTYKSSIKTVDGEEGSGKTATTASSSQIDVEVSGYVTEGGVLASIPGQNSIKSLNELREGDLNALQSNFGEAKFQDQNKDDKYKKLFTEV